VDMAVKDNLAPFLPTRSWKVFPLAIGDHLIPEGEGVYGINCLQAKLYLEY
jgi:hypothetical protein